MKKLKKIESIADGIGVIGMLAFMLSMITYGFGLDVLYNIMTITYIVSFTLTAIIYVSSFYLRLCIKRYKQSLTYRKRLEEEAR